MPDRERKRVPDDRSNILKGSLFGQNESQTASMTLAVLKDAITK